MILRKNFKLYWRKKLVKEIVYRGDILCARCLYRNCCRFGTIPQGENRKDCDEFERDKNIIYSKQTFVQALQVCPTCNGKGRVSK